MSLPPYIRLSELAGFIQDTIDESFGKKGIWVLAELSNLKYYPARQHYYFDLVEQSPEEGTPRSCMQACAWKPGAMAIQQFEAISGQPFVTGIQVLVQVSVSFHPVYGLKLVLHDVNPEFSIGQLQRQRQDSLDRLLRECADSVQLLDGQYISSNKKLLLPIVIQRIAVISSSTAAGYEDFRKALQCNGHGFTFQVHSYFARVQGLDADQELVRCLIDIFHSGHPYDVVLFVRGGGSQLDLLSFDSYRLARAVARFPIPILTGIGHQRDVSLTDLMAHTHEITPSRVAAFIISHNLNFTGNLDRLQQQLAYRVTYSLADAADALAGLREEMTQQLRQLIQGHRDQLGQLREKLGRGTGIALFRPERDLMQLAGRMSTHVRLRLNRARLALDHHAEQLTTGSVQLISTGHLELAYYKRLFDWLSPERTLRRGFALILEPVQPVNPSKLLAPGAVIRIRTADALLTATVTAYTPIHEIHSNEDALHL